MDQDDFPLIPHPWLQSSWQRLQEQIALGKLPHALMFAGQKGIGKRQLATALAQYLLCLAPINGLACGKCRGCELNRAGTHPDLALLEPEQEGKAIKIDAVRQLTDFVAKTSQQGGFKVALIEPAEAMNVNAANALLKSLEEPSDQTLLILVSHIPSGVMATIRSRCQLYSLQAPHREQALAWLQPLVADGSASELLGYANGAPLMALKLAESDALEQRETLLTGFEALCSGHQTALDVAKQWMAYEPLSVVEWVLKWCHAMAVCQSGSASADSLPAWLQSMAARVSPAYLYRFSDKVLQTKQQLLSGANPNKQLLLEELLMDWQTLARQAAKLA